MDPPSDHPKRNKLAPFLGRTFTKSDGSDPCTASNVTVWDLMKKLITDLSFQSSVKTELVKMARHTKDPLSGQHLKTKDNNFQNIINKISNDIHNTVWLIDDHYSPFYRDDDIIIGTVWFVPAIISWKIYYETGRADSWCPFLDKNLNIIKRDRIGYRTVIFYGIVDQAELNKLGESGFVALYIYGCVGLPQSIKTLQQIIMDKYIHGFDKNELQSHLQYDSRENLSMFLINKMSVVPDLMYEDPYFKRQLPENWQRILWAQYDEKFCGWGGCIQTFDDDDVFGPITRKTWYKIIEGVIYVTEIEYCLEFKSVKYIYNNDFQIIGEIVSKF